MSFDISILQPGDCLLYSPDGFWGRLIAIKTWADVSHCEMYAGNGMSMASREWKGVNVYSLRTENLSYVLRPNAPFDFTAARQRWFPYVQGQGYDWKGLLCFTLAAKQGAQDKMFCSEFMTRCYRAGGFNVVSPRVDADHVAPATLFQSATLTTIYPFNEIF